MRGWDGGTTGLLFLMAGVEHKEKTIQIRCVLNRPPGSKLLGMIEAWRSRKWGRMWGEKWDCAHQELREVVSTETPRQAWGCHGFAKPPSPHSHDFTRERLWKRWVMETGSLSGSQGAVPIERRWERANAENRAYLGRSKPTTPGKESKRWACELLGRCKVWREV